MGNCVDRKLWRSRGECRFVNLFVIVHGGSPIMNCLHELVLTGESCLESMLVMEDNVVSIEVFPHVAIYDMDDMLHHLLALALHRRP